MKGLIVVPNTGLFPYQFVASWTQLVMYTRTFCEDLGVKFIQSCLIYEARDQAAEIALEGGYDWLFFLDSDMEPAPNTIERLLQANVPVNSAICFKRQPPYSPCFYPRIEVKPDGEVSVDIPQDWTKGLAEVEGVGMACCLIRREVLEKVEKPMFWPMPILAEDLAFCKRAREAGFKIYVDTSLCCGHVGQMTVTEDTFREYRRKGMEG